MGTSEAISQRYPKEIELDINAVPVGPQFLRVRPSGKPQAHLPVPLRLMAAKDKAAMLQFARNLPQEDLLFLHTDITDPVSEDEWIANIERGTTVTVLAEPDGSLEQRGVMTFSQQPATVVVSDEGWRSCGNGIGDS